MFSVLLGKTVRFASRLRGGSGSALPGLIVEKIDPNFMARTLNKLPHGVILVSGTNGKTTTTKMVVELLEGQGLKVFTNRTGSNFTRGVAAAILGEVTIGGKLDADIAVLELDEAHAVHFVRSVKPSYSLLLNVMRDQLDRFGEIDHTARLLAKIADATTKGVVLNREDPRVRAIADSLTAKKVGYFGLSPNLRVHFPTDDELHSKSAANIELPAASITLDDFNDKGGTFTVDKTTFDVLLKVRGAYNIFNAAAAIGVVKMILQSDSDTELDVERLKKTLSQVEPAFGRGESVIVNDQPLDLVLVKNPSGFRLGLNSFSPDGVATMIAINDNYADGRDMSWLWDVEFESLRETGVHTVTGIRGYDMALRLDYDLVEVSTVETNLGRALKKFITDNPETPKRIYCTYTAMLALRRELSAYTKMEAIDE